MSMPKNNALLIATLLTVAALVCLGVGVRLLIVGGDVLVPARSLTSARLVAGLTIGGGVVVFLLATVALLAARRYAVAAQLAAPLPEDLTLVDIREWSRELEDIRDDLRRDVAPVSSETEIQTAELTVPGSWRPDGQYLLTDDGRATDPQADLKRTRDHLMEAAARVDLIVQSINETTAMPPPGTATGGVRAWLRRWRTR